MMIREVKNTLGSTNSNTATTAGDEVSRLRRELLRRILANETRRRAQREVRAS